MVDASVTDPVNMSVHPEDTAQLTTTFFDLVSNSPGFDPAHAQAASDSMSHIMATYMPSVMNGVGIRGDSEWPIADNQLAMAPLGDLGAMPLFQHDDLAQIASVAMSTEDGLSTVAGGYSQLTTQRIQALASDGTIEPGALSAILSDDAGLRGFLDRAVADSTIREGADADAKSQYFSRVISEVAGELPIPYADDLGKKGGDVLKSGYEYGVSHLIDSGEEAANDRWASAEKLARVSSVAAGETGFIQAKYDAYRTLVDSGVLGRDDLIDGTTADGNVLRFDELEDPRRFVDNINSRIINRFDLDPNVISDQYLSNYDDPFAGVRPGGG